MSVIEGPTADLVSSDSSAPFKVGDDASRIKGQCMGHLEELDHVQAALAALELRDERLGAAEPFGERNLCQASVTARGGENLAELFVLSRKGRPRHGRSVLSQVGISQTGLYSKRL